MVTKVNKINLAKIGEIPNLFNSISLKKRLEIFRKMSFIRYFEKEVIKALDQELIKCPVYLSIGQEAISSAVSAFFSSDLIFAQHRAHSVYLAFGGEPEKLIDELLGKNSGCSYGKGGSPSIQSDKIGMVGHHGLIGENVPLAVGASLGDKTKKVVCFFGDGAAEEDYVFSSMGFAITHKLPVLFICEDNDLSILTKKADRRSWKLVDAVKSIGIPSVDITDDPWLIVHYLKKFNKNLPFFINCRTCRHHWHFGSGVDGSPKWDRLKMVKEQFLSNGFKKDIEKIENQTKQNVKQLWEKHLGKQ
jgi:pyruvate dehydrogenase E1 component alpha subunit